MKKYIIIGGVAGGATAAARLRRIDEHSEILLFERSQYISYANCGLPYYLGGVIPTREDLLLQTPESFGSRYRVDVRVNEEVIAIDPQKKEITVKRADGTTYYEEYEKLLLSPGAVPIYPPIEGISLPGIFTVRNIHDTDAISSYIAKNQPREAVIVGSGFIGVEMVENLARIGMKVALVDREKQILPQLDFPIIAPLQRKLKKEGITLCLQHTVQSFHQEGKKLRIRCDSGQEVLTDMVILSIGVKPNTSLAREAGLELGNNGGIVVNRFLETSKKDIYAVGDAIQFSHPILEEPWAASLAGPANRQARIAADNMILGNKSSYEGSIGTAITKAFDVVVASVGLSERLLKRNKIPYLTSITHSPSHAGYYPGASMLAIKLLYTPGEGKLLGAQISGKEGVDKRIDQLALLIKMGGKISDLVQLEQAYAPPFSSAKDPIAIAGYVAENVLNGSMPVVTWEEREKELQEGTERLLVDVRSPEEHARKAIKGAVNIPLEELRDRLEELPKDKPIDVYCAVGMRGYIALRILKGNGFTDVRNITGGFISYKMIHDAM